MKRPKPAPGRRVTIFARRGERVTDDAGTVVAVVKRDLYRHRLMNRDDFAWLIDPPDVHTNVKATPGFRELSDGRPQVCIEGEWRPAPPSEGK